MESARPHDPEEQLPKMSFGDHLDELRRRLLRALIALGVCVMALVPFKNEVTDVYVRPYRDMWLAAFDDFVAEREADAVAAGGIENLPLMRSAGSSWGLGTLKEHSPTESPIARCRYATPAANAASLNFS
jgi:hypothetical protein